jgi:hypothetical protein
VLQKALEVGLHWFGDDPALGSLVATWNGLHDTSIGLADAVHRPDFATDPVTLGLLLCMELGGPRFPACCFHVVDKTAVLPALEAPVDACCVAVVLEPGCTFVAESREDRVVTQVKLALAGEVVKLAQRPSKVTLARGHGKLLLLHYPRLSAEQRREMKYRALAAARAQWFPEPAPPLLFDHAHPRRLVVAFPLRTRSGALANLDPRCAPACVRCA